MFCRNRLTGLVVSGVFFLSLGGGVDAAVFPDSTPLAPQVLDSIRGSYLGPKGTLLRFSIDVSTFKNLQLQEQLSLTYRAESGFNWSQKSSGNWLPTGGDYLFNLIQNSADDMAIRQVMQIHIDVNKQLLAPYYHRQPFSHLPSWR